MLHQWHAVHDQNTIISAIMTTIQLNIGLILKSFTIHQNLVENVDDLMDELVTTVPVMSVTDRGGILG